MAVLAPTISVLDQSPIFEGMPPEEALRRTVALAQEADRLGYHRFWVSEHHNSRAFASASPEILVARLASATEQIRVGTWGVLLGHHAPFKVAEQLRMLEALFPGRIDLGVGRAVASEPGAQAVLETLPELGDAEQQLHDLLGYLKKRELSSDIDGELVAMPMSRENPELWVIGASVESALRAAKLGLPYAFGSFINAKHFKSAMAAYHEHFEPSEQYAAPKTMAAVHALCAGTRAEAESRVRQAEKWFVDAYMRGRNVAFPLEKTCDQHGLSGRERMLLEIRRQDEAIGAEEDCADWLCELAETNHIDEIAIITITESHEERVESYARLAAAMAERRRQRSTSARLRPQERAPVAPQPSL